MLGERATPLVEARGFAFGGVDENFDGKVFADPAERGNGKRTEVGRSRDDDASDFGWKTAGLRGVDTGERFVAEAEVLSSADCE